MESRHKGGFNLLLKTVVDYCHNEYLSSECKKCNHPDKCPGNHSCKNCLEQIHYPVRHPNGKKDYDCNRMINFYVCDYSFKYASEMLYLMRESTALKKIKKYHVVSIGCGACPDLMALEKYCSQCEDSKTISYYGIDVNTRWKPIHQIIDDYSGEIIKKTTFDYFDAVSEFDDRIIKHANVLVLQYVISHFYNTNQISEIEDFFTCIVSNIIAHKQKNNPLVVLINDVNSNNRGRDYFMVLIDKLKAENLHGHVSRFYFDYRITHEGQRYGTKHPDNKILYKIPDKFRLYEPWEQCSSAQLLIEID